MLPVASHHSFSSLFLCLFLTSPTVALSFYNSFRNFVKAICVFRNNSAKLIDYFDLICCCFLSLSSSDVFLLPSSCCCRQRKTSQFSHTFFYEINLLALMMLFLFSPSNQWRRTKNAQRRLDQRFFTFVVRLCR